MSCRAAAIACLLLIPALLGADVTLRYQVDYKVNPSLPPAISRAINTARLASSGAGTTILIKGGRVRTTLSGATSIADLPNDKMTLLDPARQHFATIAASQFAAEAAGAMPKIPAAAQGLASSMKMTVDSRATGRTAEIQGIQAEEREFVISMGMPIPPDTTPTPIARFVMQLWLATQEEVNRNPALREFVASGVQQMSGMNPAEALRQLFAQLPGMGDGLSSLMKEISDAHSVSLRMHMEIFAPILATLSQRMPGGNNPLAGIDPNSALITMDQDLAELSTASIAESEFQIPADYTAVPLSEILAANVPKPAPAPITPAIRRGVSDPVNPQN